MLFHPKNISLNSPYGIEIKRAVAWFRTVPVPVPYYNEK